VTFRVRLIHYPLNCTFSIKCVIFDYEQLIMLSGEFDYTMIYDCLTELLFLLHCTKAGVPQSIGKASGVLKDDRPKRI